jgi:steroid 5-alpha reductase family enzyme
MNRHAVSVVGILAALMVAGIVAWAGSQGGARVSGLPLFALCAGIAFAIQWLMFIPAYLLQTEQFYDLTGSLTYIGVSVLAVVLSGTREPAALLIAALVVAWAVRLGSFLFRRIRADGADGRFDRIKPDLLRFLMTWTLQGLWVVVTFGAGLAAITAAGPFPLSPLVWLGLLMWLAGMATEVVADEQKRRFRMQAENRDRFITHGLWRYSRHPNYFGEILLWTGIAVAALPALEGWRYLTLVSPLFVYVLLTRISGVSMLEARGRKRWGEDPAYQDYLRNTPVLVPGRGPRA